MTIISLIGFTCFLISFSGSDLISGLRRAVHRTEWVLIKTANAELSSYLASQLPLAAELPTYLGSESGCRGKATKNLWRALCNLCFDIVIGFLLQLPSCGWCDASSFGRSKAASAKLPRHRSICLPPCCRATCKCAQCGVNKGILFYLPTCPACYLDSESVCRGKTSKNHERALFHLFCSGSVVEITSRGVR